MYLPSSLCQGSQSTAGREVVHLVSTHWCAKCCARHIMGLASLGPQ